MIKINFAKFFRMLFNIKKKAPKPIPFPPPPPVIKELPPLVVLPMLIPDGHVFKLSTGQPFTAIQCSDFNLFGRYLSEGRGAIEPVLAEREALGFNMLRVWAAYEGNQSFTDQIGHLVPTEYPDYYQQLVRFLALCESYRLYVELTAYTGGHDLSHWEKLGIALQGVPNVLVELVNEWDSYPSQLDPASMSPLPGILCSRGSNGSQAIPPRPHWSYEVFHTNDAYEWWRKGGHNGMELSAGAEGIPGSRVPVIENEKTRPDRDRTLHHHEDSAAAAALLIAGSCFHSQSGKRSSLFTDDDLPFAKAFVHGCKRVDLAFQHGAYRHDPAWEGESDLRVYRKVMDDRTYWEERIRK